MHDTMIDDTMIHDIMSMYIKILCEYGVIKCIYKQIMCYRYALFLIDQGETVENKASQI